MNNNVAVKTTKSIKDFLNSEKVLDKFEDILHDKAKAFVTSVLSVVNNNKLLEKANPQSIMSAAMIAATLNLPVQPSLGFTYIVPYGQSAQFQLGYKGLIQLAIRSGQVTSINADKVYKDQFISYDPLFGELKIDFTKKHKKDEKPIGYFGAFSLTNGFRKVTYWTREEVEEHAKRFSKSFNNGPWKTDFDAMARKTVLKSIISTYAPLTTELEEAFVADNKNEDVTAQPVSTTSSKASRLKKKFEEAIPVDEPEEATEEDVTEVKTEKKDEQVDLIIEEDLDGKELPF